MTTLRIKRINKTGHELQLVALEEFTFPTNEIVIAEGNHVKSREELVNLSAQLQRQELEIIIFPPLRGG